MSKAPPVPRPPGPGLRASLVTLGAGFAVVVPSIVLIVMPFLGAFTSTAYAVPNVVQLHLHHAEYTVYERTGRRSGFGGFGGRSDTVTIDASHVTVTASDGTTVPVFDDPNLETITRGSDYYTGAVTFHAPRSDTYRIRVDSATSTDIVITRSLHDELKAALPWFATAGIGGALMLTGGILLIVGATRRGRAKRAMYQPWGSGPWGSGPWGAPYGQPWPPQQWPAQQWPPQQWPPQQGPPPGPPPPPQWPPPPQQPPAQ